MDYKKLMKQYHVDMLDVLKRFILIPSVYDEKTKTLSYRYRIPNSDEICVIDRFGVVSFK